MKKSKETKRTYEELTDTEFTIIYSNYSRKVKVALIHYDLGISVVDAKNETDYIFCINSQYSPVLKNNKTKQNILSQQNYRKFFLYVVKAIRSGELERNKLFTYYAMLLGKLPRMRGNASAKTCPFSQ